MDLSALQAKVEQLVTPTAAEWAAFLRHAYARHLQKGEHLWMPGQSCNDLVFVQTGVLRYYHLADGKDISLTFVFANHFVLDYPSFVTREPIAHYYEALADCELVFLPRASVQAAMDQHKVWERFARLMGEMTVVSLTRRRNSMLFDSPEQQYLKLYHDRPKVIEQIPQHMIATYLGITREHLSRIRRKLRGR